jgi:hypothetical protein
MIPRVLDRSVIDLRIKHILLLEFMDFNRKEYYDMNLMYFLVFYRFLLVIFIQIGPCIHSLQNSRFPSKEAAPMVFASAHMK